MSPLSEGPVGAGEAALLVTALRAVAQAVVIADRSGTILWVNPAFTAMTGYSAAEAFGRNPRFLKSGQHSADFYHDLWGTIAAGKIWNGRLVNRRKDGSLYWEEMSITPVRGESGLVEYFVAIKEDVTERERAEQHTRLLAHALQSVEDCVSITDTSNQIIYVNQAFLNTYGYSNAELLGRGIEVVHSPRNTPEEVEHIVPDSLAGGWSGELYNRRRDGSDFPIWLSSSVVLDDSGRPEALIGVARDITRQRQAELELRASEENYRLLFETNPHPMWVYETETLRFLAVNQAAIAHYGFTRDEFLSMTLREVRPSEEVPALLAALWNERGRDQRRLKTVHRKKSGELIDVEIISHRLPHGGRPARLVVANDITEHLRLEEQFRQAQKMEAVGHLAGGIAHDFNNLLTVITGYSDLLLGRAAEAAPERRPLAEIAAAAARAAELTRQLLAFSRRQALRPRVLDLNALVSRVQSFLERLLGEHIQLETRLSPGAWPVRVDPAQMEQVIVNLAVNARDAMPDGGRLTLSTANITANGRHYVSLEVCDTGCGMDAATRAHIFEPFFTTKGPNKGTGLGLPTAQGIILQSGGSIDVESEPGQGTTIRISLPRVNAALDVDEIPEVVPRGGRETILLVEDQDAVRKLARRTLEEYGYHVLEAASAAEALELAQGTPERIHLAVTDVVMPGMSGREMVERLMMQRPGLLALFISGYSSDLLAPEGELVPGIRFLQKPFTPAALALKVRCVLDAGRASG